MLLFTIGHTRSSAENFFARLRRPGLARVLDTRLNTGSQLSGFAKRDDLRYFLRELSGLEYQPMPQLAPTPELLAAYRSKALDWDGYAAGFLALMAERRIETSLDRGAMEGACLLCSEATPHHCHRRLVAEYLAGHWPDLDVHHL